MKRNLFWVLILLGSALLPGSSMQAQNISINTDGSAAETGVMLDVMGTNAITTIGNQNIFQVKSLNASGSELKFRMILGTHSTAGSRFGGLEVYDALASTYRNLSLVPSGGNVGIGTTGPGNILSIQTSTALDGIFSTDGTRWMKWMTGTATGGAYNNITQASDNAIIYSGGGIGTGALVIAPWIAATTAGIRMDNAGYVGIGVTTPLNALHVSSPGAWSARFSSAAAANGGIYVNAATGYNANIGLQENAVDKWSLGNRASDDRFSFIESTGATEHLVILQGGNVGIGKVAPGQKLTVAPNASMTFTLGGLPNPVISTGAYGSNPTDGIGLFVHDITSGYVGWVGALRSGNENCGGWGCKTLRLQVPDGSGNVINAINILGGSGNVGIGATAPTYKLEVSGRLKTTGINETSDQRLKKNIHPIGQALSKVQQMQGVTFDWRKDEFPDKGLDERPQIGLIAQDVERIFPELVHTDNQGFKSVEYSKMVAILLEAIKEQQQIISGQKEELEFLKVSLSGTQKDLSQLKTEFEQMIKQKGSISKK